MQIGEGIWSNRKLRSIRSASSMDVLGPSIMLVFSGFVTL